MAVRGAEALRARARRTLGLEGGAAPPGATGREAAWYVPGRIEVFGKHTDYGGGRSLLAAVERGVVAVAVPAVGRTVEVVAAAAGGAGRAGMEAAAGQRLTLPLDPPSGAEVPPGEPPWSVYARAVVRRAVRDFPDAAAGARVAFAGDLPLAAGLSSSSALVVALWSALADVWGLGEEPSAAQRFGADEAAGGRQAAGQPASDPVARAAYLGAVETGASWGPFAGEAGVGVHGGSEDHAAVVLCRAAHLLQCAFVPLRPEGHVRLPDGWRFVVAASGVRAEKTGGARAAYNRLAAELAAVGAAWRTAGGRSATAGGALLQEGASAERLVAAARRHAPAGWDAAALARRAAQFAAETLELIPAATAALRAGDSAAFGGAAARSAELGAAALGNQLPETLHLTASARRLGAAASSPFGAGFGGSVWALVTDGQADVFARGWQADYERGFPECAAEAAFFVTGAADGARRLG
ncbi:MAG: galactokinase family protein [Gemmatimonadota bacterium]